MTYDSHGNVLETLSGVLGSDDKVLTTQPYMQTGTGYTANGNYETSQTDERGYTTSYGIDALSGLTTSVTDALNRTTQYSYNANS